MALPALLSSTRMTVALPELQSNQFYQCVRHKGFMRPLQMKPRWVPRAKTKMFVLPNKRMIPDNEINQILTLKFRHREKISAVTQYLWEDYLKNSDVGEAATVEARLEQEEHDRLLEENRQLNEQVAGRRAERLEREERETRERIAAEVERFEEEAKEQKELADKLIRMETEDVKNVITTEEQLENAIAEAMDNPIDYEYAIDTAGHIYHGRYTKSKLVPESEREKIPRPPREQKKMLLLGTRREELEQGACS